MPLGDAVEHASLNSWFIDALSHRGDAGVCTPPAAGRPQRPSVLPVDRDGVVLTGTFMVILDTTIINVALSSVWRSRSGCFATSGFREHRPLDVRALAMAAAGVVTLLLAIDNAPEWG